MSTQVTVTGILTGGNLFTPKTNDDGKVFYNASVVLDEGQAEKINAAVDAAKARGKENTWGGKIPSNMQLWAVREGDDPEFQHSFGKEFIHVRKNVTPKDSKKPATMAKRDGMFVEIHQDEDLLYPGAHVAVSVEAFPYSGGKGVKPGISLALRGVMFLKHGERLGGATPVNAENEFAGLDSDLDVDDLL